MTKNSFRGIVKRTAHQATKGKRSEDILAMISVLESYIGVLESIISSYRNILLKRNNPCRWGLTLSDVN